MKLLVVLAIILASSSAKQVEFLSDDFIESINQKQSTWAAARNFPEDTPIEQLRRLTGGIEEPDHVKARRDKKIHPRVSVDIPESFDAREEWPFCESIGTIRNQGQCASCWAFAAAEVMTDRLCIGTKGKVKFDFAPEDIIECCEYCGNCIGGAAGSAFDYWVKEGVVSGGDFLTNKGCKPYQYSDTPPTEPKPKCAKSCLNDNYKTFYMSDKHYGSSSYYIPMDVEQIQIDIMTNGPVTALYSVYDDFYSYKTGVYQQTTGVSNSAHIVKIIGWGVENDTPYWLIANSWGDWWGGLNGFFKFLRGQNHCGIEGQVFTAQARLW